MHVEGVQRVVLRHPRERLGGGVVGKRQVPHGFEMRADLRISRGSLDQQHRSMLAQGPLEAGKHRFLEALDVNLHVGRGEGEVVERLDRDLNLGEGKLVLRGRGSTETIGVCRL